MSIRVHHSLQDPPMDPDAKEGIMVYPGNGQAHG